MPVRLARLFAFAVGLAALTGCGPAKLNESRSYDIEPGSAEGFELPAQAKPQKITVDFSSSDGDVIVLLFKVADAQGDDALIADAKKALGMKKATKDTLSVDVPENTATRLVVRGTGKKTKVDVKVTNQK